eukprot:2118624-Amphidinium_carterae.3
MLIWKTEERIARSSTAPLKNNCGAPVPLQNSMPMCWILRISLAKRVPHDPNCVWVLTKLSNLHTASCNVTQIWSVAAASQNARM